MTDVWTAEWLASSAQPALDASAVRWGGKGRGLLRLVAGGFQVPEFFILSSDVMVKAQETGQLCADFPGLKETLALALKKLPDAPVAVRSSAAEEDGDRFSLAGQFDTFLGVPKDVDQVADKVVACWVSLQGERATAYRQQHGLSSERARMAVVVQTMVPAERSVVIFSGNPATGDADEVVVSSVWGLGAALVSGDTEGDTEIFTPDGSLKSRSTGSQARYHTLLAGGEIAELALPSERLGQPVLSPANRQAARRLARNIAEHFDRPVDIEASFLGDTLWVLQARPITTPLSRHRLLWDNSNIVESYDGVTTPLTFSHACNAYRLVYTQFGRLLGVPRSTYDRHERQMMTYIGLLNGRVYYNLLMWYLSMAHLPGYAFTRGAMENMMGVRESLNVELPEAGAPLEKWTKDFPRLVWMLLRGLWAFGTLQVRVNRFWSNFEHVYAQWHQHNFDTWETPRLMALYHELVVKVLHRWEAPILTDVGAMLSMAALQKALKAWVAGDDDWVGPLLVATGDIESTRPTERLMEIAGFLKASPAALALLQGDDAAFWPGLHKNTELTPILKMLEDWLACYGDRAMGELRLEAPTPREEPAMVVPLLRTYVALEQKRGGAGPESAMEATQRAESRLHEVLQGRPVRGWVVRCLLHWTRQHVRNRENMRFARTRLTGVLRRLFKAVGRDLVQVGILRRPDDVFFLSVEELTAYVDGRSITRDLGALADMRRREYAEYPAQEPPDRFVTIGLPAVKVPVAQTLNSDEMVLQGTPCSPGEVEAPIRIIRHPSEGGALQGEIVVAARTDPGWVALYPAAKGLLVEKGSVLSHSAIVAREMGLPTIVGIPGLCQRLRGGERVHMDGKTGVVRIVDGEGNSV
ncbi:MAG: PEP/pyruvate-binding domain-containing protein [Candidatus Sericytochromatia bacterium]|nr:PEP/pyruvate-binding domain-containing protein [Candidatus Sericytochromatia bacterium]